VLATVELGSEGALDSLVAIVAVGSATGLLEGGAVADGEPVVELVGGDALGAAEVGVGNVPG
jgi:hypothetical protein